MKSEITVLAEKMKALNYAIDVNENSVSVKG